METEWNLTALERVFIEQDLPSCKTEHEKNMARTIHGIGVRKLAQTLKEKGRLTPAGLAIAEKYGFRA